MKEENKTKVMRQIEPEWDRLMRLADAVHRGRAVVVFNEGKPVMAEITVKKISLDREDDFNSKVQIIPLV